MPLTADGNKKAGSGKVRLLPRALTASMASDDRVKAHAFGRARSRLASTGQFALVARAELLRCASRVASLVLDDCPGFEALQQDAPGAERAYAAYLAGRALPQEVAQLPVQHQGVMQANADPAAVLTRMQDPYSRLVAANVL